MSVLLEASRLTVRRAGKTLLEEVSFCLGAGEVLGVVGPNGAGKSTLLSALAGSQSAASGGVFLAGRSLNRQRPDLLARQRAVLYQALPAELPYLVEEVVAMGADIPQTEAGSTEVRVAAALAAVELATCRDRLYTSLSGGEQRRVQLARVLAQLAFPDHPVGKLLLLDEPYAGLDVREVDRLTRLVRRLRQRGASVVVALHDLTLAPSLCDRVLVLDGGRIVTLDEPVAALTSPASVRLFGATLERASAASGSFWVMSPESTLACSS